MPRPITLAGAQLGPIHKADDRASVVKRLCDLMRRAHGKGARLVVFPELALTTFFPRWYMEGQQEVDTWFETEMPNAATKPLFELAASLKIGFYLGYAEKCIENGETHRYNTAILVDQDGKIVGKYRKVHLPGHKEWDPDRSHQHLEKRYFEPGDLGFPVWRTQGGILGMCICNDRRWAETYRVMGLQGGGMVLLGYNTPVTNSLSGHEVPEHRIFHHKLSCQAGAYQNSTWVVAVAKAGDEDGFPLMAGTIIVDPQGLIMAETETDGDELITHACDLDEASFGKRTIFNFAAHRRTEHYGLITERTGAVPPPEDE